MTIRPDAPEVRDLLTQAKGTDAPWYRGRDLTAEERAVFRRRSQASRLAKQRAVDGSGPAPVHRINVPRLDPSRLMPPLKSNGLRALSLFSGCGGLDLGFDRAGFTHVASYELIERAAQTLLTNRPKWTVFGGADGDVRRVDWRQYRRKVDVVHGGPPCQPFSSSGRQLGAEDVRDMWPEFVRAVLQIEPLAFLAENVPALKSPKFAGYVQSTILAPLEPKFDITQFEVTAESMGVPQVRRRVLFVGFRRTRTAINYSPPEASHLSLSESDRGDSLFTQQDERPPCMGVRHALGLPDIGFDALAPTIRSGLTGPRHTTSILSSVSAQKAWERLGIWPNGVALTRKAAQQFVARNGSFRLSVPDCALMQGFPENWKVNGAVYMAIGQIGNAVAPPVAYALAKSMAAALR